MGFTPKLLIGVGVVWAALTPPLFTGGSCTAEFEAEVARLEADVASIGSSIHADAYFNDRAIPHAVMSVDQCRSRKPRQLDRCGEGPLVIAKVPVRDPICRIYRDDEIAVWLQYDGRDRLVRRQVDMSPYKSLTIPFAHVTIHWAR